MSRENESVRLLIIGNGFDLAHELPTSYVHFLMVCKFYRAIIQYDKLPESKTRFLKGLQSDEILTDPIKDLLKDEYECRTANIEGGIGPHKYDLNEPVHNKLASIIVDNVWVSYFLKVYEDGLLRGKNWIDFEREISNVVEQLDSFVTDINDSFKEYNEHLCQKKDLDRLITLSGFINVGSHSDINTVDDFICELYRELNRLTKAFEIYLIDFAMVKHVEPLTRVKEIKPNYVISFNYTNTYSKVYDENVKVCYIHGRCDDDIESDTNMIIGIGRDIDNDGISISANMAIFKKYVQRIRKKTDMDFSTWEAEMVKRYKRRKKINSESQAKLPPAIAYSDIYIYGHSLDITDKDVLERFLKPDFSIIHIYAYGETEEGRLISNLIKMIGEDTVIKKSNRNHIDTIVIPRTED